MRVLVLNMGLFNSLEISTSNKLHCRIVWLNIKCVECEQVGKMWSRIVKVVLSYHYPSRFRDMRHILHRPYSVTGFINQWGGGVQFGYLSKFLHYVNANVISFSLKHIRVWRDIFSSKRKIIWKVSVAWIFNKCPKMHENECYLAGDTISLNDHISGVIHCIRFIPWTIMKIKT